MKKVIFLVGLIGLLMTVCFTTSCQKTEIEGIRYPNGNSAWPDTTYWGSGRASDSLDPIIRDTVVIEIRP